MKPPKLDIGLVWAKYVNIWGQLGSVAGTVNILMMIGVFYTTTLKPNFDIPLWLYVMVIAIGTIVAVGFILKVGISGYYRFFSNRSELSETNRRVNLIMNHLGIADEDRGNAKK